MVEMIRGKPVVESARPEYDPRTHKPPVVKYTHEADRVIKSWVVMPIDVTADHVRAEAQRRIIAVTGARDLQSCFVKQLNASMRANELNDKRVSGKAMSPAEEAEAAALRGLAEKIKAVRAASNVMEQNPPADYTDDARWPG